MTEKRLTMTDVRAAGYCSRGIRAWFAAHGYDFQKFLREGASVDELRAMQDGDVQQVLDRRRGDGSK